MGASSPGPVLVEWGAWGGAFPSDMRGGGASQEQCYGGFTTVL